MNECGLPYLKHAISRVTSEDERMNTEMELTYGE